MELKNAVLAVVLVAVVALAASQFLTPRPARAVTIGYGPVLSAEPLYVAVEKGFFAEEGLNVTPVSFASSNELTDALASGRLDAAFYGSTLPVFAAHAVSPGKVLVMGLSDMTVDYPVDSILVLENSSIRNLSDLAGRKVGVYLGNSAANFNAKLFKMHGVNSDSVTFVRMPPVTQLPALESGAVDAVHTYEPVDTIALESGKYRAVFREVYGSVFPHTPLTGAYISGDFIKRRPADAAGVYRVMEKSYAFMKSNDSESRAIAAKWLKLDANVAGKMHFIYQVPSREYDSARLQAFADLLYETGDLKQRINASETIYSP